MLSMRGRRIIRSLAAVWALAGMLGASSGARAVPAFARQTGEGCAVCHVSFPELTSFGRFFKLGGYTIGQRQAVPLSGMLLASVSSTRNTAGADPDTFAFDKNDELALDAASGFLAGKLADHVGVFNQWTYDGIGHHLAIDNTDLRWADSVETKDRDLLYGLTLHNSPTAQDVWNSTPAFGYPYASSPVANVPAASTLIDGGLGAQVAGFGGYLFWNRTLYGELTAYRTADGAFSILRQGTDKNEDHVLDGYSPYWRFALNGEWGPHSAMVGTYGLVADLYPDPANPAGPTDRYRDYAFDAQYQYVTDPHAFTAQLGWIREKTDWDASFPAGGADNPSSILKTFRAKTAYHYQRKYGATLAYFSTTGDTDNARFNSGTPITGSANGSPDSRGFILEVDYLPWQQLKLGAQYTAYRRFNGADGNYDGAGRNAGDNNTLYLFGWLMF